MLPKESTRDNVRVKVESKLIKKTWYKWKRKKNGSRGNENQQLEGSRKKAT